MLGTESCTLILGEHMGEKFVCGRCQEKSTSGILSVCVSMIFVKVSRGGLASLQMVHTTTVFSGKSSGEVFFTRIPLNDF